MKPAHAHRREPARPARARRRTLDRRPERRAERRARAAVAARATRSRSRPSPSHVAHDRLGLLLGLARQEAAVDGHLAARRDDVALLRRVRSSSATTVMPSSGSTISAASGSIARASVSASPARRHVVADRRRGSPPSRASAAARRANSPSRSISARRLDERVVGDPRHRAVAAAPVHVQHERRAPLLGRRAEIEHAPADLDPVAGAFVDRVVAAHGVRVRLGRATRGRTAPSPDLLVGGRGEDQVAGRLGTPRARARRSRPRSPRPGPSCRARRGPRPRRRAARPTTDRPTTPPGRRAPCPCARGAAGAARRRGRGMRATRFARSGTRRVELALDAVRLEVVAQQLRRRGLVPRRVDRVRGGSAAGGARRPRRAGSSLASR